MAPETVGVLKRVASANFADLRRRKLTLLDVLGDRQGDQILRPTLLAVAGLLGVTYAGFMLPRIQSLGTTRLSSAIADGVMEPRPGGPYAHVSWAWTLVLSVSYSLLAWLAARWMEQRRLPPLSCAFEFMTVHYAFQLLLNIYCIQALVCEAVAQRLSVWGNPVDTSAAGHRLGWLIWLQYHSRQLQLLDTLFMIMRRKYEGNSFLHSYLRVINLWGWYVACRFVCYGEAFVPTLTSSVCQGAVYGIYFFCSCYPSSSMLARWTPRVSGIHLTQYVLCIGHSVAAAAFGNFPWVLAVMHLFALLNGLVLYSDFQSCWPKVTGEAKTTKPSETKSPAPRRVTFSFDSCGWLFVYHFGVGVWLSEHMGTERKSDEEPAYPEGVAFSGSSGGSLIACVLGAGTRVRDVFEFILGQWPACRKNPLQMFPAVEKALRKYVFPGAYKRLTGRIRVLLTRVTLSFPFVMGEVADAFEDNETAVQTLCASCHVPVVAGVLPLRVRDRYYYDGLVWPSRLLVPWRGATNDHVVRVSACGAPLSDVRMSIVPFWWGLLPPPLDVLRGVFWCGYRDAGLWFATPPKPPAEGCACSRKPRPASGGPREGAAAADTSSDASADHTAERLEKWKAAQCLLEKRPGELPSKDPVTGQDVQALIRHAESYAEAASRAATFLLLSVAGGIFAVAVALDPSLRPWTA
eukprot:TRINITY_DN27447_c0_g1_i1.p1 TRINITY_DN27447_c0_g1~~TRINITY_DN27447_c0_g1_i1.p1  ORF type:complete len:727 (+),score=42.26 TRINITY_DN27447_c0_g1_i1:117-2183(+)